MTKTCRVVCRLLALLSLGGCDGGRTSDTVETLAGSAVARPRDSAEIRRGAALYRAHCATCHGARAEGDPAWRHRGVDGFYPPPPLDGSGHAWHHPTAVLVDVIRNGSPPGQGRMPAWGDTLDESEILAVIAWFQSLWPDEVYGAWSDRERRPR